MKKEFYLEPQIEITWLKRNDILTSSINKSDIPDVTSDEDVRDVEIGDGWDDDPI